MLSVQEALQLEEMNGAEVVAGSAGLKRSINWVHVASVPDAPNWLHGGEFILTTAYTLPEKPLEQCQYVQAMADKGIAALALAVGRYIEHIPDYLRLIADHNQLPLIEIPFQSRFIDIARALNERITEEHMETVERALYIHRRLTQLALDNGDLQELADTLAGLIGQSISIENDRFEALVSANIAPVDEARRYTVTEGRTNPDLIAAIERSGILNEIRTTLRPVFIPQMAEVGLELERILAPIVVHGEIYGYVWIIADSDRALSDIDRMAIESGATIAALMLLHQESIQVAEASLKGGLLSQLIQGESERELVLRDQALRYGLDLDSPYVMIVVENQDRSSQQLLQVYRRINRLAGTQNWNAVVSQFAGQVVVLSQAATTQTMAESILLQGNGDLRVSVSGVHRGASDTGSAHEQCIDALQISRRLTPDQRLVYFDDLGYLYPLYRSGANSLNHNPYVPCLRELQEKRHADLFNTLETYLDAGGNTVQTAKTLHIHRSTLNYRLDRIKDICDLNLSDPVTRTNLQMALKLLRLFEGE